MTVIDSVDADQIEEDDLILLDSEEIQVRKILECEDITGVAFEGYSLSSGSVDTYQLPYNHRVDILGA